MNTFSLILFIASVVTGIAFAFDFKTGRPKRMQILKQALAQNPNLSKKEQRNIKESGGVIFQLGSFFPIVAFVFLCRAFVYEPFRIPSGSMEPTLLPGDFIAVEKWAYGVRNPLTNGVLFRTGEPQRGDVVVFKYPEDPRIDYIKRVVGLPGDEIVFDNKRIYIRKACEVDGKRQPCGELEPVAVKPIGKETVEGLGYAEEYVLFEEQLGEEPHRMQINMRVPDLSQYYYRQDGMQMGSWIVPEDHYFMMGDNRDNSKDSRFWGFVPYDYLIGRTVCVWMSLEFERGPDDWLPSFIPSSIRFSRIGGLE